MKHFLLALGLAGFGLLSTAQNKTLTIQEALLKGRTTLAPARLQNLGFVKGTNKVAYVEKRVLKVIEPESAKEVYTLTLNDLNKALLAAGLDTLASFEKLSWENEKSFLLTTKNGEVKYDVSSRSATKWQRKNLVPAEGAENMDTLAAGETVAYTKDNDLYVSVQGNEQRVSSDGSYTIVNGKSVHRDEFGIHKGTFWSPQGTYLAYYRMDQSDVADYPIVNWATYPASNTLIKYPMAGSNSHYVTLRIYHLRNKTTVDVKTEGPRDQYLTNVCWSPDEKTIYIALLNREQNHMRLNAYDAATGNFLKTLFEEKDDKYVEPLKPMVFLKNNPNQFIWQSRRDGFMHLYLYNRDGVLMKQLTKGNWEVKDLNGFDARGENFLFHANEQSPVNQDVYAVHLKTGKMTRLTQDNGFHTATFSPAGDYFIDNFSSCYTPRETRIVSVGAGKTKTLFKAENPVKEYQLAKWNLFSIRNNEGIDLYCRMFKPVNFDSTKKYPVLVYLYNGPHSQLVTNTWMAGGELWYHYMAQKGFIVFTLDGRGTSNRGKAFEQAVHRRLGEKEMEDQLKGVDYLKSLPYVDAARIGVFGWSFGGFMATSLMTRHAGTYKVGVAGGPVIDWSYYEVMYGERYMDTPKENPEGYAGNNLLNHADKLKGKLLMIHGAQDDVVVWQHSILFQKKAVDKGIQMDYYVYPGHLHNVLGKDRAHLFEKITNYFIDHL